MNDLVSKGTGTDLQKRYVGDKITPSNYLYQPMILNHYEIIDSRFNPGSKLLVAQASYIKNNKLADAVIMTEGTGLIGTLRKEVDKKGAKLPATFKFVKTKTGKILFSGLNKKEKEELEKLLRNRNLGFIDNGENPFDEK